MKFLFFTLSAVLALSSVRSETMTEVLLRSQAELSLAHEFAEEIFLWHRSRVVPILADIQHFSLTLYLDSISTFKGIAQDTRDQMAQLETNTCTEDARERWERQVLSHLNRVNFCIQEAVRILNGEYFELDFFDRDGARRASNQVQNQGIKILSTFDVFRPTEDFHTLVNTRLRDLLMRAAPWAVIMDDLTALMNHHTEQARDGVAFCMQLMINQFRGIANNAIQGISQCTA